MPNALEGEIRRMIAADGPMPVARYMALCLGHERHGYYMTRDPFGGPGDFITAPEISQMFGEMIGLWVAQTWADMGAPQAFALIEPGPGRGTLMADMLAAMKVLPGCVEAARIHLVEISPALRSLQRKALGDTVTWHATMGDALDAAQGMPAIVVANEFFDALPVHQLVCVAGEWRERLVGLDDAGKLAFVADPRPSPLATLIPEALRMAEDGAIFEISPASLAAIAEVAGHVAAHGGAGLFIDYGHVQPGHGDTFQAVRQHKYADPLADPGMADLTAHVDFAALAAAAADRGAAIDGPTTQGRFLSQLGIGVRAGLLARNAPQKADDIRAALARLTDAGQMGELFKVLGIRHPELPPRPGFS